LKGFEDSKDRQVINDVVDNIISDRIEMIEQLSLPENPEKLYDELDEFIEDFQSLTQKEGAVLEEAYLQKQISRTIGGLENQRERLESFLESEYSTVTNYKELKELLNRRENLLEEIDELQEKIGELEVEKLESEISDIEEQLSELENSSEWNEYEELQDKVKWKKSERKQLISDLKTSLSKMERGLKKLIYQARNGDTSVGSIRVLEKLQNKNTDRLLENPEKTAEALKEAEESLPEDLLNDRQQKKFLKAIEEVEDIPEISEQIDSLESEVEELEKQIENHSVINEKSKLESEKKAIEKQLEDEKSEKQNLEKRFENRKSEAKEIENKIREVMKKSFDRDVLIN
jgi:DNA repair exonuclease SbcCD ATPase subunit